MSFNFDAAATAEAIERLAKRLFELDSFGDVEWDDATMDNQLHYYRTAENIVENGF